MVLKYQLGDLNNRNLFSHHSRGWKSKIWVPSCLGSGEDPLPDLQTPLFQLCLHLVVKESKFFDGSSYEGTNPITRAPPS